MDRNTGFANAGADANEAARRAGDYLRVLQELLLRPLWASPDEPKRSIVAVDGTSSFFCVITG